MIAFTKQKFQREFHKKIDPRLRAIMLEIDHWLEDRYGETDEKAIIYITSVIRDKGIHSTGRALDFDWWGDVAKRNLGIIYELENHINKHFPYGKGKFKTFLPHSSKGFLDKNPEVIEDKDFHIHLQVKARR